MNRGADSVEPPAPLFLHGGPFNVLVRGGRIVRARGRVTIPAGTALLDCKGAHAIEAGAVNAHTHLFMGLAPLMPSPDPPPPEPPPEPPLERLMERAMDRASLTAAARLYVAESVLVGTTSLIDLHQSSTLVDGSLDIVADAMAQIGVRGLVAYGATDRGPSGALEGPERGARGLHECARFLGENRRADVRGLVGIDTTSGASDETLRAAGALCTERGTVLHLHLAERIADVKDAIGRGFAGPLERLAALGALPAGSILAHGVHLTESQARQAAEAGHWFVQSPRSNIRSGVGYPSSLDQVERVALGTDGRVAYMGAEMEALEGRPVDPQRRLDAGRQLVADRFGARAGVEPGALADLVVRDEDGTRHVVIGGRVVVHDRRLVTADHDAIWAEALHQAERLWDRMQALRGGAAFE